MKVKKRIRQAIKWVSKYSQAHRKTTFALKSLLTGWSAVLLGFATMKLSSPLPYQSEIAIYLTGHHTLVGLLLIWPLGITICTSWASDILEAYRSSQELTSEDWYTAMKMLNDVVGTKTRRFGQFITSMPSDMTRATAFLSITQPEIQMESLVANLRTVLVQLSGDRNLGLVLAKIENDIPVAPIIFVPSDDVPPPDLFGKDAQKTLFCKCAQTRKTIFIPDIERELRRSEKQSEYARSELSNDGCGSILCHPLIHPYLNQVQFCLSVKSDKKKLINEEFTEKYRYIIESFAKRILLESSLEMIKRRAIP